MLPFPLFHFLNDLCRDCITRPPIQLSSFKILQIVKQALLSC